MTDVLSRLRSSEHRVVCPCLELRKAAATEIEHLRAYQQQMNDILKENERLNKKCGALAWLLYGQTDDGRPRGLRETLREILDELQVDDARHDLQAKVILALRDICGEHVPQTPPQSDST